MNNKNILKKISIISAIILLMVVLTGCAIPKDPVTGEPIYITLDTTFKEVSENGGIFDLLLTYPLAQAINFTSKYLGVFGGITLVTLVINLILLVFTFKSNVSMQKMQMMQPELEKIQKKYEGNDSQAAKAQMAQEMQRLYDKNGVNPLSALSSFVQLPIFFCMYAAVNRSYAVAHGTFMKASLALTPREAVANGQVVLIVIYVCMIIFQLISTTFPQFISNQKRKRLAKIQHKPYTKPQNQNAFMMYGMVVMIGFVMISWPTALSLYYAVVSIINILKTLIVEVIMQKKEQN